MALASLMAVNTKLKYIRYNHKVSWAIIILDIYCEEVGGTGSASNKGCNNEDNNSNCYSFATYHSNKSILKT